MYHYAIKKLVKNCHSAIISEILISKILLFSFLLGKGDKYGNSNIFVAVIGKTHIRPVFFCYISFTTEQEV